MRFPDHYVFDAIDFFTSEPREIARITYGVDGVLLAARVPGGEWEATWVGPPSRSVRVPPGLRLTGELLAAVEAAPRIDPWKFEEAA